MFSIRALITLFIVALALRVGVFGLYQQYQERYWQVDSRTYHLTAQQLAAGNGFTVDGVTPHVHRLPGYPIFLAFWYKLLPSKPLAALWAQVVLSALIPLLIIWVCMGLFPGLPWVAYGAGWLAAVHLGLVLYAGFLMTETLFSLFFLLFLGCFFRMCHLWWCPERIQFAAHSTSAGYNRWWAGYMPSSYVPEIDAPFEEDPVVRLLFCAGLALGAAGLIRPVGHYALVLTLLCLAASTMPWRTRVAAGSYMTAGWLCTAGWWLLRNYLCYGAVFFHTLPGGHFLYLSAARVAMHVHACSYQDARKLLEQEVNVRVQRKEVELAAVLSPIQLCRIQEKLALEYFAKQPLRALQLWCTDMARTLFSLYSAELLYLEQGRPEIAYFDQGRSLKTIFMRYLWPHTSSWLLRLTVWYDILFLLTIWLLVAWGAAAMLAGLLRNVHKAVVRQRFCAWARAGLWCAFFIVLALAGGYARMRLPIEPLLFMLAAYTLRAIVFTKVL